MTTPFSTTDRRDTTPRTRWPDQVRGVVLVVSLAFVLATLGRDIAGGGDGWKQGDWLINDLAGPIRRGPFGTALIALADLLGTSPLTVVAALQAALVVALYLSTWRLGGRVPDPKAALVLTLSPAMFAVFWVSDPEGALRKELFALFALALTALGAGRRNRTLFATGSLTMALAVWAHEAMILFLPTWLALAALALQAGLNRRFLAVCTVTLAVLAALGFTYAIIHPTVADHMAMCAPLLDRGLDPHLCDNAIRATEKGSAEGAARVKEYMQWKRVTGSAVVYVLSLLAAWTVIRRLPRPRLVLALSIAAALPFLPLYPVALDWGRWISFHVHSVTLVLMTGLATGLLRLRGPLPESTTLALVLLALLISPIHTAGANVGGAVLTLVEEIPAWF